MPELPEVETIARGLASRVTGDVIESVWLGSKPEPLKSAAPEIVATLESKRIMGVRRVGKHIVFDLENGRRESSTVPTKSRQKSSRARAGAPAPTSNTAQWIVHLGMTGRMLVCKSDQAMEKHTHAVAKLASGRELRFVDPRRFGRLSVAHGFDVAGSEPLEVELHRFVELFRGRKTPIKSALLNQKLLRGVGNIYADESLFRAAIRPRRRVDSLTRKELSRLHGTIREVLKEAISLGGSSI
jgi:formamidopyrimidine-DNA glycosylase